MKFLIGILLFFTIFTFWCMLKVSSIASEKEELLELYFSEKK